MENSVGTWALRLYAGLIALLLIFPLAVVVVVSVDSAQYIQFPPEGFTLRWYQALAGNENFMLSLKNSLIVGISSTAIALLVAIPAALVLSRRRFPFRDAIYAVLLSSLTIPWIVYGLALLVFWGFLSLRLSLWTLIVGHTVIAVPYVLRTVMAVLLGLSPAYEQAARNLGAGPLQAFFLVTLPMIRGGVLSGASFALIVSLINIPVSLFVTTADNLTMPVAIFSYMMNNFDPGVAAFAVVQMVIVGLALGMAGRAARG